MIRLTQSRRAAPDSIVPMINVAFLLLIFFLMTAVIAPPDPIDVTLPAAEGEAGNGEAEALVVSSEGELAYGTARGQSVFAAIPKGPLRLRADAALPAADLARIVARLQSAGITRIDLVTLPR